MIKLEQDFKDNLYRKARNAFKECIGNEENNFLRTEIDFEIEKIGVVEDYISFKFFKNDNDHFLIEVKLQLCSPDNEKIGKYLYCENEAGMPVDDSLVFD